MRIDELIWLDEIVDKLAAKHLIYKLGHADYDDTTHSVQFDVRLRAHADPRDDITLVPELRQTLQALANARGVSLETLVNVWLTEKVLKSSH